MSKYILSVIALLVSTSFSFADDSNCVTKEQMENLLKVGGFFGLSKGTTIDNITHEVWLNAKNQMTVLSYEKLIDKDSKICIISMTNNEMYNAQTIEILHKDLEKK